MFLFDLILLAQVGGGPRPTPPPGGPPPPSATVALLGPLCCWGTVILSLIPMYIGMWKVFEKAGQPGWAALVPVYNLMILAKIAGKDETYGLLCLLPCGVGLVFLLIILLDLCKEFDVGAGYAAGLILVPFVFWPMLGFGAARYRGGLTRGGRSRVRYRDYEDDDDYDDRPRRRRYEDEDDYDDRPPRRRAADDRFRRRRDNEDDARPPRRPDDEEEDGPRRPRLPSDDDFRTKWNDERDEPPKPRP